ncbi:Predicted membrane protein [Lactobacillus gasseri ATCC 33323 = JCM 1131]|uniref:Predicted membrane protein n=1 Tax=Lactobacillus gasseri (strain ATCC 33323 / DSM 20243 / BCRC 14619 / CIP 102991 / JCM 1131 / KCTC 3163 / NCIMB 11718 / NCTC 13722 / AM63) TaxID=324831 RepID=A0A805ZGS6_LACGA|nr:Predicted membrane protein [Lactobacillus gasseri ATCC 33323 = JCM 1131]
MLFIRKIKKNAKFQINKQIAIPNSDLITNHK